MTRKILVPVDIQDEGSAARALQAAGELAGLHGAEVHVMTVVPTYSMSIVGSFFPDDHERKTLDAAREALSALLEKHAPAGAKGHVAHGTIYDEIMKIADQLGCDLIVMASHRPELKDYLLGPNAARVVRHASQSVYVVRDPG